MRQAIFLFKKEEEEKEEKKILHSVKRSLEMRGLRKKRNPRCNHKGESDKLHYGTLVVLFFLQTRRGDVLTHTYF